MGASEKKQAGVKFNLRKVRVKKWSSRLKDGK